MVMQPYYERDGISIYVGDNREVLPHIEQVHAVVNDPPYGLSFMGKGWDHQVPGVEFWQTIMAAMLPGAHLLAFGGTRTYHRMAVAIEDAGYEMRDTLQWIYGSGFPKSHDVSKAIDKMAGAEREVVGTSKSPFRMADPKMGNVLMSTQSGDTRKVDDSGYIVREHTEPATPAAEQWQGWGTALKPAYEPIIMARLPFKGTVAANVLAHGTGAINVDACRIPHTPGSEGTWGAKSSKPGTSKYGGDVYFASKTETDSQRNPAGRWPANVILDEAAAEALDAQSGVTVTGGTRKAGPRRQENGDGWGMGSGVQESRDTGGASRFFYVAKASRRERNAGLEGMPERAKDSTHFATPRLNDLRMDHEQARRPSANSHPTVKPLALMRYLIQMVTPPEGIVLDPFAGSGSTLVAAAELGFNAIGIELSEEYAEIAAHRVDHALNERAGKLPLELAAD